jgi:hypothetical protein
MPKSLKEQLEESFDGVTEEEKEETGGPVEDTEESVGDAPEEQGEEVSDDADSLDTEDAEGDEVSEPVSAEADEPRDEKPSPEPEETYKAPASWTPSAREHWAKLDKTVQAEITKREGDIQKGLHTASQYRKVADEYFSTIKPYEQMIRSSGVPPATAINQMFQTAHHLTYGGPKQKAEVVRDIIQNYGVDIETLDHVLADMDVPDSESAQLEQLLEKKLSPVTQFMQQYQQNQQRTVQEQTQSAEEEINQFGQNHEFFEDVREDMADIIEMTQKRGQTLTLEQAYERACAMNPEISKVLAQRQEQQTVANMDKKRRAASSLASESPNNTKPSSGGSLRDTIAEAFEE